MSGERAKRFPLGLADLVREPRRSDGRGAQNGRTATGRAATGRVGTGQVTTPGVTKPASAKPATTSAPERRAELPARTVPGGTSSAPAGFAKTPLGGTKTTAQAGTTTARVDTRPNAAIATRPTGSRSDGSLTGTASALAGAGARTTGPSPGVTGTAARTVGAPAVALNGALALTSERVRERMVERLRTSGIGDARVLQALAAVPRHMFVDPGLAAQAYEDAALPIGHHQTISKPSVVARMLELAGAGRALERVLEIGTGCGYQAAVLSRIARDVYSIERIRPLYERAKTNLRPLRIPNIRLHYGDGRLGLPAAAPFDAIVIAAAGLEVPQALLEQLAIGGRLIAPVAEQGSVGEASQVLTLVERVSNTQWRESRLDRVFFVPLKSGVI